MKKVFAILAMAALASCGGSDTADKAAETVGTKVDSTVNAAVDTVSAKIDSAAAKVDSATKAVVDTLKKK